MTDLEIMKIVMALKPGREHCDHFGKIDSPPEWTCCFYCNDIPACLRGARIQD